MAADGSAAERLPSSNRGVSCSGSEELARAAAAITRTWAGLDWLSGSVDLLALLGECDWGAIGSEGERIYADDALCAHLAAYGPRRKKPEDDADTKGELRTGVVQAFVPPDQVIRSIAETAFAHLFGGTGLKLAESAGSGKFYAYRYMVTNVWDKPAGMIELGGELTIRKGGRPSLRFELTGMGCAIMEQRAEASADHAQRWCALRAKLERLGTLLSRADIAFDDFDGKRDLALAVCMYHYGEFDYSFAGETHRPKARGIDDYDSGDGKTVYIGHSTSEKQLRVYEKGRQLGDAESPWVRWELQLRSSSRKRLTLDVMTRPLDYMRGAFQCLDFVSSCLARLAVTKQATKATVKSVLRHAKRMYGATFNALQVLSPASGDFMQLMEFLGTDKPPGWAKTGRIGWDDVAALINGIPPQPESENHE